MRIAPSLCRLRRPGFAARPAACSSTPRSVRSVRRLDQPRLLVPRLPDTGPANATFACGPARVFRRLPSQGRSRPSHWLYLALQHPRVREGQHRSATSSSRHRTRFHRPRARTSLSARPGASFVWAHRAHGRCSRSTCFRALEAAVWTAAPTFRGGASLGENKTWRGALVRSSALARVVACHVAAGIALACPGRCGSGAVVAFAVRRGRVAEQLPQTPASGLAGPRRSSCSRSSIRLISCCSPPVLRLFGAREPRSARRRRARATPGPITGGTADRGARPRDLHRFAVARPLSAER